MLDYGTLMWKKQLSLYFNIVINDDSALIFELPELNLKAGR